MISRYYSLKKIPELRERFVLKFFFNIILVSKLSKNAGILTKNIYESIMLIQPMKRHCKNEIERKFVDSTLFMVRKSDRNKTCDYPIFERKEKF